MVGGSAIVSGVVSIPANRPIHFEPQYKYEISRGVESSMNLFIIVGYLTYVKHKPGSRMIVLVIIVLSPFLSLKTVLLEIYFMN